MQQNSEMLQLFNQKTYQLTLQSFVEDFRAKHFRLQEKGKDSMTQEEHYFLKLHGFCDISKILANQSHTLYSKMLKVYLTTTMDEHLLQFMELCPTLIIPLNANYLILNGGYPKIESEYILSDILEGEVDQKYFLSQKMILGIGKSTYRKYGNPQKKNKICNTLCVGGDVPSIDV